MRGRHEDVKLEPGQITVSEYQMRVGGFDDGNEDPYGDPAGEPESDPAPFLMASPSGPEVLSFAPRAQEASEARNEASVAARGTGCQVKTCTCDIEVIYSGYKTCF